MISDESLQQIISAPFSLSQSKEMARELLALRREVRAAVETINKVQNFIAPLSFKGDGIMKCVNEAWNANAEFLSNNPELQNEYLRKARAASEKEGF